MPSKSKKDVSSEDKNKLKFLHAERIRIKNEISNINMKYAKKRGYRAQVFDKDKFAIELNKWIDSIKKGEASIVDPAELDDSQIFDLDTFKDQAENAGFEELVPMIKDLHYQRGNVGSVKYTIRLVKRKIAGDRIWKLRNEGMRLNFYEGHIAISEAGRFSSLCEKYPALPWVRGFNLGSYQKCAKMFTSSFKIPEVSEVLSTVVTTRY